ncbi:hypothetical protein GCM10012275_12440 [Longimycelium tulufanense]|uniref:CHAD domain-containing protein n=2 Tax=Longimycelium tulufanense TaxID=907463 RepID=A0A8J3FSV5_9PSEU|nr:hypothetical protein GCM10012275_12440 [Longimycelium tulufanense]
MRVAVRRMRAVLRAARPALDRGWADELRAELGWLGRALGPVRDLDVLIERLREEAAEFGADERAAVERLLEGLVDERERAREQMLGVLDDERYGALLRRLAAVAGDEVPTGERTDLDLRELVRAEFRKVRRDVRRAGPQPPDAELHALRIRVKRLRYTAELADPVVRTKRLVKAAVAVQDVLGEHQDSCVAEERVRELLSGRSDAPQQVAFAAGRLVERERTRRAACRAGWWKRWDNLAKIARKI